MSVLGIDGKPCMCTLGFAKITNKFDNRGNQIEVAYFGSDGKPCLGIFGYAKVIREYDERGNVIKSALYDIHGEEMSLYVTVDEVLPDSNGEKLGIQEGDFFILYDGLPVESDTPFIEKRSKETGDEPHELVVLRDNEFLVIQTYPGKLGCVLGMAPLSEEQEKLVLEKLKEVKNDSTPPEND